MKKIYYIGLAFVLVVLVSGAIFLTNMVSKRKANNNQVAEQPKVEEPAEVSTPTVPNKKTVKASEKTVASAPTSTKSTSAKTTTIRTRIIERVTIDIPAGIEFTKKCTTDRCVILIWP